MQLAIYIFHQHRSIWRFHFRLSTRMLLRVCFSHWDFYFLFFIFWLSTVVWNVVDQSTTRISDFACFIYAFFTFVLSQLMCCTSIGVGPFYIKNERYCFHAYHLPLIWSDNASHEIHVTINECILNIACNHHVCEMYIVNSIFTNNTNSNSSL